jgi:hypothetical protein
VPRFELICTMLVGFGLGWIALVVGVMQGQLW